MDIPLQMLQRWYEYNDPVRRAMLWMTIESAASAERGNGGWTELLTITAITERVGISRNTSADLRRAIAQEFDAGMWVGRARAYRSKALQRSDPVRIESDVNAGRSDPQEIESHTAGREADQVSDPQRIADDASTGKSDPQEITSAGADHDVRAVSDPQRIADDASTGKSDPQRIAFNRDTRGYSAERSAEDQLAAETIRTGSVSGERDLVDKSTRQESLSIPDPEASCDNGSTPAAVAPDVKALLGLSIANIMRALADGQLPRERALELADGELVVAAETGRNPRTSLIQRVTEFRYAVPAVESRRMFGAICDAFGYDLDRLTHNERGEVNKAAAQLVEAGREPDDVPVIYAYCRRQGWSGGFKPTALLNHASAALASNTTRYESSDNLDELANATVDDLPPGWDDEPAPSHDDEQVTLPTAPPAWWAESLQRPLEEGVQMPMRVDEAYRAALGQLELRLDGATYRNRIEGLEALYYEHDEAADTGRLVVAARNATQRDWVTAHVLGDISDAVSQVAGHDVLVTASTLDIELAKLALIVSEAEQAEAA